MIAQPQLQHTGRHMQPRPVEAASAQVSDFDQSALHTACTKQQTGGDPMPGGLLLTQHAKITLLASSKLTVPNSGSRQVWCYL